MGGPIGGGPHAFVGHGFGVHHSDRIRDDRFRMHDDRFFFHHHRHHVFFDIDFVAFGFPWWYPYPYPYWYPYDYAYYDYAPSYDYQYWARLAVAVQSELTRRGYYHGPVDGVIGSDSRQAIRAFQAAQGLPVTGMIDPRLLKSLGISYRRA